MSAADGPSNGGGDGAIVVVFLGGSGQSAAASGAASPGAVFLPPALSMASAAAAARARPLADQWWDAVVSAGLGSAANCVIATTATYYKAFEFWGFSKGLAVHQIVNSGRSIGSDGFVLAARPR